MKNKFYVFLVVFLVFNTAVPQVDTIKRQEDTNKDIAKTKSETRVNIALVKMRISKMYGKLLKNEKSISDSISNIKQ